jgi:hypothetical protein
MHDEIKPDPPPLIGSVASPLVETPSVSEFAQSDERPILPQSEAPLSDASDSVSPTEPNGVEVEPQDDEWEDDELPTAEEETPPAAEGAPPVIRIRRRKKLAKSDAAELRLQGRRALCKSIIDIAPFMLKMVKLRLLGRYLQSVKGLEDDDLTNIIKKNAEKLADRSRILGALNASDQDFSRSQIKGILFSILLQEETHSIKENRLDAKAIEFEKELVKRSKSLDFAELKKQDPDRWHHYDTYRIVLEAAWSNDGMISPDEASLLAVLRRHLAISSEEHWLISALLKRFPKEKCALHTPEEVDEARKELQREGLLWSYRDEDNHNIDILPAEIAAVVRRDFVGQELQKTNYRRLIHHDSITLNDLRGAAEKGGLNKYGNKSELIDRVVNSNLKPSEVLNEFDREKLSAMCACFGLKSSGTKAELIERLIAFYDDLTFEERVTKDEREVWYNNYELLANRAYAELRAKKIISKDLEIEHYFEGATAFLFSARLHVTCDRSQKENRADGRLPLENDQCILWDCKSVEGFVNLQDHLEGQFDAYLRKDREAGKQPLAFLVIGPAFTPQSIKLAHQYKARTNWDIALATAEGLKHMADRWAAAEPNKPFPIRLLNRTELIDKERAEFLLSLA